MPRDFRSSIKAFVPDDPEVNVVSFPWCVDVPDLDPQGLLRADDQPGAGAASTGT